MKSYKDLQILSVHLIDWQEFNGIQHLTIRGVKKDWEGGKRGCMEARSGCFLARGF